MFKYFCVVLLLMSYIISFAALAQGPYELQLEGTEISDEWKAGGFLIYDCKNGHFACVDKKSFEKCTELRQGELDDGSESFFSCASLKDFSEQEDCVEVMYDLITNPREKEFCQKKDIDRFS